MTFSHETVRASLSIGLFALFAAGLGALVLATGWAESLRACAALHVTEILALLGLSLANYLLRALRWHLFARAVGLPPNLTRDAIHYIGGFAMTATPGRIGEFVRLRWIFRETGMKPDRTGVLALVDRAADLAAVGIALALIAGLAADGAAGATTAALLAIGMAWLATRPGLIRRLATLAFRLSGRGGHFFAMVRRAALRLNDVLRPGVMLPATLLGVIGWGAEAWAFHLLLVWMGADIALPLSLGIFFVAMLTGGATGLPGGLGGAEAAMIGALALAHVPLDIAIPATAVIRLTTLWFAIALGIVIFPLAERRVPGQSGNGYAVESADI